MAAGGAQQEFLRTGRIDGALTPALALGIARDQIVIKKLKVGSQVPAGTVLGRIGAASSRKQPFVRFEIRPAGRGAPRIDPKPILDGWKLLESTAIYRAKGKNPFVGPDAATPTIGQILLMSKQTLQQRVLADPRIQIYDCGRQDIKAGQIDRRVLATLEFLVASGFNPTVTSLNCGHSYLTASGNVSEHSTGTAVDIAAVNGIPILGNQGKGSITELVIQRLLTLQGTMKPHQIISLMTFPDADNTLSLADHDDHIHVGFRPRYGTNTKLSKQLNAVLKPSQWTRLIERLGKIDNPTVRRRSRRSPRSRPRRTADGRPAQLPLRAVGVRGPAGASARALRRAPLRGRRGARGRRRHRGRRAAPPRAPRAARRHRAGDAGDGHRRLVRPATRPPRTGGARARGVPAPASSSAHRVSAADPGAPDPGRGAAHPRRRRHGRASWPRATGRRPRELEAPEPPRVRRRSKHRPAERLAALLSARDVSLACEELTLRARGRSGLRPPP